MRRMRPRKKKLPALDKNTGIGFLQELQHPKKPSKKIDKIVKGVLVYWIIFVSISWITFWIQGSVPDTLIQYGLGGGAVELIVTGFIEITRDKISKKEERENEQ